MNKIIGKVCGWNIRENTKEADDVFVITRKMIFVTRIQNLWRRLITSNPKYKGVKARLKMIRVICKRGNGVAMYETYVKKGQFYYNISSESLFTLNELSEATAFIHGIIKRRIETSDTNLRTASIINEAKSILDAGHR